MKKLLLPLLLLPITSFGQTRYTVKGVVSYYFNQNYGDKPDTGARAFILTNDDLKALGTSIEQIYRYQMAYLKLGDPIMVNIEIEHATSKKAKERLGNKPAEYAAYKAVADSVSKMVVYLDVKPEWQEKRATADGSGVFTKKVVPGEYIVVVFSAHRQKGSPVEINGQMDIKKIVVKDDDLEVPIRFGLY